MNDKLKEYLWSSFTTFVSAFALAVMPMLGNAPMETGFWLALFMTGAHAGIKALVQYLMNGQMGELLGAKGRV
jgi:hypothetical protein